MLNFLFGARQWPHQTKVDRSYSYCSLSYNDKLSFFEFPTTLTISGFGSTSGAGSASREALWGFVSRCNIPEAPDPRVNLFLTIEPEPYLGCISESDRDYHLLVLSVIIGTQSLDQLPGSVIERITNHTTMVWDHRDYSSIHKPYLNARVWCLTLRVASSSDGRER